MCVRGRWWVAIASIVLFGSCGPRLNLIPPKDLVFYTTRPTLEWPAKRGETYRFALLAKTKGSKDQQVVFSETDTTQSSWRPDFDLEFATPYELRVFVGERNVANWRFTIAYQTPEVRSPRNNARVRNLKPTFTWYATQYDHVYWQVQVAERGNFDAPVEEYGVVQLGNVNQAAGEDGEKNTQDDVRTVSWKMTKKLKVNQEYDWRITAYYYAPNELKLGTKPDLKVALAKKQQTAAFSIAPQPGSDLLSNITRVTSESEEDAIQPTMSVNLQLAYVLLDYRQNNFFLTGAEIKVVNATMRSGRPTFDRGREAFTIKVENSVDYSPQWDVDGGGLYFASNRGGRDRYKPNIWYKRRESRGYTQLTFHDEAAWTPAAARDGNRIAYEVFDRKGGEWLLWLVDRDGKAATEIGKGRYPRFSPDGKRIAFALKNQFGCNQIWMMDVDGSNRVQLTNDQYDNNQPAWHPKGNRIAFMSDRGIVCKRDAASEDDDAFLGNPDIWEIQIDGAQATQLTNYIGDDSFPEYTPDGNHVLFSSDRGSEKLNIWMGRLGE
jgi:hypothetical protein